MFVAIETPPAIIRPLDIRQEEFLRLLPAITAKAETAFRFVPCPHDREDAVAEVVAHLWEAFVKSWPPCRDAVALVTAQAINDVRHQMFESLTGRMS